MSQCKPFIPYILNEVIIDNFPISPRNQPFDKTKTTRKSSLNKVMKPNNT